MAKAHYDLVVDYEARFARERKERMEYAEENLRKCIQLWSRGEANEARDTGLSAIVAIHFYEIVMKTHNARKETIDEICAEYGCLGYQAEASENGKLISVHSQKILDMLNERDGTKLALYDINVPRELVVSARPDHDANLNTMFEKIVALVDRFNELLTKSVATNGIAEDSAPAGE